MLLNIDVKCACNLCKTSNASCWFNINFQLCWPEFSKGSTLIPLSFSGPWIAAHTACRPVSCSQCWNSSLHFDHGPVSGNFLCWTCQSKKKKKNPRRTNCSQSQKTKNKKSTVAKVICFLSRSVFGTRCIWFIHHCQCTRTLIISNCFLRQKSRTNASKPKIAVMNNYA